MTVEEFKRILEKYPNHYTVQVWIDDGNCFGDINIVGVSESDERIELF